MTVRMIAIVFTLVCTAGTLHPQKLPKTVVRYLDRNFRGWKLAGECLGESNNSVLYGDFDGNGKRDHAVKFVQGERGFLMAILDRGTRLDPYYLHIWTNADEARYSSLILFKKGERDEQSGTPKLRFDSPADYHCESDVGGIHAYRNGKFIAY
ncbi:MAG: hypothetical protein ABI878_08840 [Acidobacteriota bacterium]